MSTWWNKRFAVERKCTCKLGQRGAECGQRGYHVVDSHELEADASADAAALQREVRVPYRVVDQHAPAHV